MNFNAEASFFSDCIAINPPRDFQPRLEAWLSRQDVYALLDSNGYCNPYSYRSYDYIAAWEPLESHEWQAGQCFDGLKNLLTESPAFRFGFLGYDLKNEVENLQSRNEDFTGFPDAFFFRPKRMLFLKNNQWYAHGLTDISGFLAEVMKTSPLPNHEVRPLQAEISTEKSAYLENIAHLRHHIAEGDIYEVNYCVQFKAHENRDAMTLFQALRMKSPMPFAGILQWRGYSIVSASPERFLKKNGNKLIAQPIKGTVSRGNSISTDSALRQSLALSEKDRAENVMIVDLTRNDLTRYALPGTVKVEDLFGVYTFPMVHQMISTVSAQLKSGTHAIHALKQAFPMGSMTGAPKVRAMQLIEDYENFRRGPFSGALGYFDPAGDFDFNVLIRSIFQNHVQQRLAFCAGGAITWDSNAAEEWDEMLLKAAAVKAILGCK